ncbi:hypothetical protein D3C78_755280 [compost metagenome]
MSKERTAKSGEIHGLINAPSQHRIPTISMKKMNRGRIAANLLFASRGQFCRSIISAERMELFLNEHGVQPVRCCDSIKPFRATKYPAPLAGI